MAELHFVTMFAAQRRKQVPRAQRKRGAMSRPLPATDYPRMTIGGRYLADAGFRIGNTVAISFPSPGVMVATVVDVATSE